MNIREIVWNFKTRASRTQFRVEVELAQDTHVDSARMRIKVLAQRVYSAFVFAALAFGCSSASADWTYSWGVVPVPGAGGGVNSTSKYFSYASALEGARHAYSGGYGFAWKHVEPAYDPSVLASPILPTVGYVPNGATTPTAATPAALCQLLIAAANTGTCSVTYAGVVPWLPATFLDYWQCNGNYACPDGSNGQVPEGYPKPNCPEDGYAYSGFGGPYGWIGRVAPPHTCKNGAPGQIGANFDPGKCNDNCPLGNPISPALGIKSQQEPMIVPIGLSSGLEWTWYYSTKMYKTVVKNAGWSHSYSRQLAMAPANLGPVATTGTVWVYRPDGIVLKFRLVSGAYVGDADIADRLTRQVDASGNTSGWTYYVAITDDTEIYDAYGRITSLQRRGGAALAFTYSDASTPTSVAPYPGLLIRVTDALGRQFSQTYNSLAQLNAVVDAAGNSYAMAYDSIGNLQSISYPVLNSHGQPSVRTFLYENAMYTGALTGIVDEEGMRFSTYTYDSEGRAIRTEHSGGVEAYSLVFNADGSSTVTDPLGTIRTFGHSLVANAIKGTGISLPCTTCGDGAKAKTYDGNGNVTSRQDFNGKMVCFAYDTTRNLETARLEGALATENCSTVLATPPSRPDARKITTTWNATWRLPATITEPTPGGTKTTTFTYDASGNLTQKTIVAPKNDGTSATLTRTWSWTYGTLGRVLTATDPNGKVTTYAYYSDADANLGKRGNVQTITNPLGHVTQITAYDANARALTTVDPNGLTTTLTYDARGRLIDRNVGGEQTTYFYDGVGQLTQVVLPDFSTLNYTYDAAHRLKQIQDGLGNKIVYTLDAMGNRKGEQAFDPGNVLARTRTRAYDSLNRLAQDIGALSQTTIYAYDGNGNVTSVTDPLSHATGNSYDALNRLVQVLDPANGTTQYSYDPASNLAQVTDPRGLATAYAYDGLGNLTKLVSPDTGTTTNTYDAAGNVLTKVDARGVTATYTVDALNRVASIAYSKSGTPTETHTYTYDSGANAKGRLSQLVDTAATTAWTYTPLGRVASKTQSISGIAQTLTYGYNAYGQLTSVTTPSGQVIGYTYTNNRVSGVTVNGSTLVSGVTTFPFGAAAGWQWGNAEFTFRRFDADGRLASWEFRNGVSVLRNDLSFDAASRITALSDHNLPANSGAYQYDVLDRLTVAQQGSPVTHTQQFAYDALGNRQNVTIDGSLANLYYGSTSNQLQQMIGIVSPTYLGGATALNYAYNNANRMVQVQSSGTTLATYAVNGLGQRVQKVVGATTTRFVYDEQGRLLGEYDGTGKLIQETVWLDELPVATLRPTGANGMPTQINVYYVHADHLGSPRAVTRPSDNAIMWRWDNVDPFGANAPNENPAGQGTFKYALRFPGQYYDAETGTHYNYFRDYDPAVGRYEQSDLIGLRAGPNTYGYVVGNPTRFTDPKGLWSAPPWCGILPGVACYTPPFSPIRPPSWWPDGSGCGDSSTDWIIPDTIFAGACKNHDRCYETCGMSKAACDLKFLMDMLNSCARNAWFQNCQVLAAVYYSGVFAGGGDAYRAAQRDCPGCR